jgi:hypothetical protein
LNRCPLCKERLPAGARRCAACGADLAPAAAAPSVLLEKDRSAETSVALYANSHEREQVWRKGMNSDHVLAAMRALVVNHAAGRNIRADLETVRVYYALAGEDRRVPVREKDPTLVVRALEILIDSGVQIRLSRKRKKAAGKGRVPPRGLLPSGEQD